MPYAIPTNIKHINPIIIAPASVCKQCTVVATQNDQAPNAIPPR